MRRSALERYLARFALGGMAIAGAALTGVGVASWAMADTSGFYSNPVDRGRAAGARLQPIADDFWKRQTGASAD